MGSIFILLNSKLIYNEICILSYESCLGVIADISDTEGGINSWSPSGKETLIIIQLS